MFKVLTEVSARHIHLSKRDFEKLFGLEEKLKNIKNLSQPGEFASDKVLILQTEKNKIENIRIVGPFREQTQVEISQTDAYFLGINPPIRVSGNLIGSEKGKLIGLKGEINLKEGIIIAQRHLHLDFKTAQNLRIKNNESVNIKVNSEKRTIIFQIRIGEKYKTAFHIDTDEANASGIKKTGEGILIKEND